jgi:uncharacterized membrane-anchored protein YitT (DUF2179 family)
MTGLKICPSANSVTETAKDILFDVLGCAMFTVGIQMFSSPNRIAPGGVTGLSVILNYLTGWSVGSFSLLLNLPLLALAWLFLGMKFTLKTLKTVLIMSLLLDMGGRIVPAYVGEPMLAALYGGVFEGLGLALVMMRGGTTGGSDIVSRLLQLKFPGLSVGRLLLVIDGCVLVTAAFVYRNIENALYGLIAIFASTRILDSILYGLDTGRVLMIISRRHAEIADAINRQLGRGCTRLRAEGSYTGEERPVLYSAVRKAEFFALKRIVYRADPAAFVVALEASEIVGEGFKNPYST